MAPASFDRSVRLWLLALVLAACGSSGEDATGDALAVDAIAIEDAVVAPGADAPAADAPIGETPDAPVVVGTPDAPVVVGTPDAPIVIPDAPVVEPLPPDAYEPPPLPDAPALPPTPDAPPLPPDAPPGPTSLAVCATGAPYTTITAAITAAGPGATIDVCAGTYVERLVIQKPLTLRGLGGAAGTIIDGAHAGTVVTVFGADVRLEGFTIRNGATATEGGGVRCEASTLALVASVVAGNTAENGGGLYASGCTLTVSDTRFEGNDAGVRGGGAWIVDAAGSVTASHFVGNQAIQGGGLAVTEGTLTVSGSELRGNTAALQGGGLFHESNAAITANTIADNDAGWTAGGLYAASHPTLIEGNLISGNTSVNDGGGVYVHQGAVTVRNNHITGNTSGDDGGGLRIFTSAAFVSGNVIDANVAADCGAGVRISHLGSLFEDNTVTDNVAGGTGGGFDLDNDSSMIRGGTIAGNRASRGGGIYASLAPWFGAGIEDVTVSGNRASRGGGICLESNYQAYALDGVRLIDNVADRGGGLYTRASTVTVRHVLFDGNQAYGDGGGLWAGESPAWVGGPTRATIDRAVFHHNVAPHGAAVWTNHPDLTVENAILFAHDGVAVEVARTEADPDARPQPAWSYVDVFPATFTGMADPTGTDGNLSVDPGFTGAATGDFHLLATSACIDAGDPVELDPDGTRADMGWAIGPGL